MGLFKKNFAEVWGAWHGRRAYPGDEHTVLIPVDASQLAQTYGYQAPVRPPFVPAVRPMAATPDTTPAPDASVADGVNVVELRQAAVGPMRSEQK